MKIDGGIGVGCRLEIGDELLAFIATLESANALVDLVSDISLRNPATGAEATIITEGTATGGYRAIDIGTGKSGVDTDFLNSLAKSLSQVVIQAEIATLTGLPVKGRFQSRWHRVDRVH